MAALADLVRGNCSLPVAPALPLAVLPGLSKGRRGGMKRHHDPQPRAELRTSAAQEICSALTRVIPSHWNAVTLTLTPLPELGGGGLSHEIWSPEGHDDVVLVPMELIDATQRLERNWLQCDATFQRAVFSATRQGRDWSIHIGYEP